MLQLVENLDKIINKFDEVTYKFYIEQPDIPAEYHSRVIELCEQVSDCAENMAIASRAFSATSAPSATIRRKFTSSNMNPI